jgi:hypothetical protein
MRVEKQDILELLARNEEKISELYSLYAEQFGDPDNFWLLLANEETSHALWIRQLKDPVAVKTITLDNNTISPQGIVLFTEYITRKIKEAKENTVTLEIALSTALDVENALIEKSWFDIMQTDSDSVVINLNRLRNALKQHRDKITQALTALRKSLL